MELISVVIPTFNRRAVLPRAIESVLGQKGPAFELIVVDDGSTDGTPEMIRERYPAVRCLSQKNRGPAAARNRGIEASRGPWIAFLDSDDEWLPGKLESQAALIGARPDLRIHQTEEIWIRNGRRVNPMKKHRKSGGMIFERCLELCLISPSAVMLHRELLEETGAFDESFPACEDYELWLRISARHEVGYLEKPGLIRYGGHADQRSREFPAMDRFRIRALEKILASGWLTEAQHRAACRELEKKAEIYIQGALKRNRGEEAGAMRARIVSCLGRHEKISAS